MKKAFAAFVVLVVLGVAALCIFPGYVTKEADRITFTEQVIFGDPAVIEGVTVDTHYEYDRRVFWDTTYVAGATPETKTEYSYQKLGSAAYSGRSSSWYEERGMECLRFSSGLSGGWGVSSTGGMTVDGNANIERRELTAAFEALAEETKPGEEKSKIITLRDYFAYWPIHVMANDFRTYEAHYDLDELGEAYAEYFKIPVPEGTMYEIKLEKNSHGEIVSMGGSAVEHDLFQWKSSSACTETDFYFSFLLPYGEDDASDTELYGIYRQPYVITDEKELEVNPKELELVYIMTEDFYSGGELLMDINAANQLLLLTDNEERTCFQVLDLETFEQVQYGEFPHAEAESRFLLAIRATDEFLVLLYGKNYMTVMDWQEERGYAYQFSIPLSEENLLWNYDYENLNDFDWNGEQLIFASHSKNEELSVANSNFELTVYDKTGQIYHGKYANSLLTPQEYEEKDVWGKYTERYREWNSYECTPRSNVPLVVTWP